MASSTQAGEKIVDFGFLPKQECDVISDDRMAEIARRITGTVDDANSYGTLYVGPTAPLDKRRPWLVQDPVTLLVTGSILYWNIGENAWLPSTDIPSSNIQSQTITVTGDGTFAVNWPQPYADTTYLLAIVATGDPAGASFYQSSKSVNGAAVTVSGWTANFTIFLTAIGNLA